jgi:hypothetical protein
MRRTTPAALLALAPLLLAGCGSNAVDVGRQPEELQVEPAPVAELTDLTGGSTSVTLAPEFLEGLTALELTPGVVGAAQLADGVVSFPVTGGEVTYFDPASRVEPFVTGEVEHEGSGLRLTAADGTVVELTDFVVDPGESELTGRVTVGGQVAAPSAPLFFLDGRTLRALDVDEVEDQAVLTGTTVSLTAEAAELLNGVLGTEALEEFFPVGVAEIRLDLPAQTEPSGS